ncbi:DUF6192 family protein [Streptomyces yaizuensis]|uniref:Uncharacterized protein n=1 Tax=Streptomyces yaizuensis TaxID=2989713 RepID=A0ABQ5NY94_9ACTN|nr:DUF6192 family protein [Streptomyces sp. YSPA8]GLF95197.1 hypothetical protein SYYSPA8_12890 [Streptomyces sp. YSPA8]
MKGLPAFWAFVVVWAGAFTVFVACSLVRLRMLLRRDRQAIARFSGTGAVQPVRAIFHLEGERAAAQAGIGSVSRQRYEEILGEVRELVSAESKIHFRIGDLALEIEPLREHGGAHPGAGEEAFGVRQSLEMFAEGVGIPYGSVRVYRFTAGHWPPEHRVAGVPFEIHRILEQLPDRFERITDPPVHPRTGQQCWTQDAAKRQVGWRVSAPQSVQEKVEAIRDLAADEQVAARVAADLLRRPAVAERAAADDTARHLFNRAQNDRWHQPERSAAPAQGPDLLRAYELAVVRQRLTEIRRLMTSTVLPHAALDPDDRWIRHVVAQLNSVESTLDLIA